MVEAWERQKGESAKAYGRFKIYLELSPEQRSSKKVLEKLQESSGNSSQNNKIPSLYTIERTSAHWKWVERAALYDASQQLKEAKKYEADFTRENKIVISLIEDIIDYCSTVLESIKNNDSGYALSTQIGLLSTLMGIIDRANYNIRTCYGKPAKYNDKYDVDLDNKLSVKEDEPNIFKKTDKELEEILSVNDDFDMEAFLEEQK